MGKEQYNPKEIEKKWQDIWGKLDTFKAETGSSKPKYYALVEFPYPSGVGLHVGHARAYTGLEILSRKKRMEGYNVLFPIGWDAFGLPTENYAIKTGIHPRTVNEKNIEVFTNQLKSIGYSFDFSREIDTADPKFFKWTQWIFLKLFENGLAYKNKSFVNFCPDCKVVLANEEAQGGKCDRCDSGVIQMEKEQWMLKITEYADKLLEGLEEVDYTDRVKTEQINWIGRSYGAEVDFAIVDEDKKLPVYTTRPDTLYGVTFMVIAPEHPIIEELASKINNLDAIIEYRNQAHTKSEFERVELAKDKTGVKIDGISVINPLTNTVVPVFVADYVMMGYGTGAIMAVPAHDQRDWEFAKKFGVPIIEVIKGGDVENEAYTGEGKMVNSGILNGMSNKKESIQKVIEFLKEKGVGKKKTNYKMKDWPFARQRYWGEPVPIIHCTKCGMVPVPYEQLPLTLPEVESYSPTNTGESPLSEIHEWVNTTCPTCGLAAKRETDTMPQWAGSSWYFLRYTDPKNNEEFASKEALNYWMGVDCYNGGMEHVTRHLIYSRFWHRFLYDCGYVNTKEPYKKRTGQGLILGSDNEKMSKSKGNVVNPDDIIKEYGADTLRLYVMFIGDYEKSAPWNPNGVKGCRRFLDRLWKLQEKTTDVSEYSKDLETTIHRTIKKVSQDIENIKYNTAIAALMSLLNEFSSKENITRKDFETFLLLIYPFAPHITEELWQSNGYKGMLNENPWPLWDEAKTVEDTVELVIQIKGKIVGKISVPKGALEDEVFEEAMKIEKVQSELSSKEILKKIHVPDRLLNIVVK